MSPRPGMRQPSRGGFDHNRWLDLVEVSGPFLSIPVLRRAWPAGLDALGRDERARLRAEHADYFDAPAADRDTGHWIRYVLTGLLGWEDLLRYVPDVPGELTLEVPEHGEIITPDFVLTGSDGAVRLVGLVSDGPPTGRVAGSGWSASPADRLAQVMRRHEVPLGLATDGRWWVLVRAPRGKATAQASFDASLWREERDLARAFVSLLGRARFFGVPDDETLPAMLDKSQEYGEEITEALGVQVRRAVELLIGAIGQAEEEVRRHRPEVVPLEAHEAYVGAVTVMMRLVFLLFAEDRHLLPNDDPVYQAYYSASRLVDELERQAAEPGGEAALEHTDAAWHRLLALFRAVHGGVSAGSLHLPAYDGSLFDPDSHPWLEGRFTERDGESTAEGSSGPSSGADTEVLGIDDRTVMHMLQAVQYVEVGTGKGRERRRLTFASLDVEQIGYVYEGLLGFDAFRADDVVLGLTGRPGEEDEVSLQDLEDHRAAAWHDTERLAERLADRHKDSGIGSVAALTKKLTPLTSDETPDARRKLLSATGSDPSLTDRLLPFYRLLRPDLASLPTVFRKGTLYVTQSPLRRFTGTHYTPRFLAEQVVEGALAPLVYSPGPLQTADTKLWKLRHSTEILSLKIADIAMGSAAFLVAAARYLAKRLIEAWGQEDDPRAQHRIPDAADTDEAIDTETDPVVIEARRLIIEHCLYGTDINPMAVEMAKLSLWLVSMDPSKPFTFVDDKVAVGDSLLGITSLDQLEWMHLDPRRGRELHENRPWAWTQGAGELAAEVAALREQISRLSDAPENYATKRQLLQQSSERMRRATQLADLLTGAGLAAAARKRAAHDPYMIAANLARLATDGPNEAWDRITDQTQDWLNTDHVLGSFVRSPLHWPLAFPEVFLRNGAFDAIIGNPPFLGGPKIPPVLGASYREMLVETVGRGVRGTNADLIAFFALQAHRLLNSSGQVGLIGTNTLAQGDTREVGLDQIILSGVTIRQAVKSAAWPSRSAVIEYCAIWTSRTPLGRDAARLLDGVIVKGITSSLDAESRVGGQPGQLAANDGICHYGSDPFGMGFTLGEDAAQQMIRDDLRNARVLSPFLNGEDVNSKPDSSTRRWIINFYDWGEDEASTYRAPFAHVRKSVKPERATKSAAVRQWPWWKYWRSRPALYATISKLEYVIVIARVSKAVMPVVVPARQVFSNALAIFVTDDRAMLAFLSSVQHYWWALSRGSSIRTDLRYTPADVFGTLPLPDLTQEMRDHGAWLDRSRRDLMLARQAGLTKTYNLVHDPRCKDSDIAELREIHREIDHAVIRAYGWNNLDLDHDFHETRQGIRYTVGPVARQEILDRLLELNHERYAAEVAAGLHKGKKDDGGDARLF